MSAQAFGWVLDHSPAKGTDRLVLLSIANHAGKSPVDGAWTAFPGVETIRQETRLDRSRTVQDALARLIKAGSLLRIINGCPDERIPKDRRPNLYSVLLDNGVTCDDTRCNWCYSPDGVTREANRGDAATSDGVTPQRETGCREASPKPRDNRVQPSGNHSYSPLPGFESSQDSSPPAEEDPEFVAFYEQDYPKKTGRKAAYKAWLAARQTTPAEVIRAGGRRYRSEVAGTPKQYIASPAAWLNGERWNDEPGANVRSNGHPFGAQGPRGKVSQPTHPAGVIEDP